MSSQKNTTTGRALGMASMGAGIVGSYVGYLLQRVFLGEVKGKIKLKSTHIRAARRMANEMQALRGPAMKLGQMLSLQTGVLPDEILAELATLQMEAPGMHPSLVRAQVKGSLGREPEEIEEQIVAETDYLREADNIEFLADRLAPLSFVKAPRVFREYSSDKVLTMSLMTGRHLEDFLSQRPSQKLRDELGAHLFELFQFQVYKIEALH